MRRVLLILALVLATRGILVGALDPALAEGDAAWPIAWILWAPVGYLILVRRPGNGVGAAALLIGLLWGVGFGMLTLSVLVSNEAVAAWLDTDSDLAIAASTLAVGAMFNPVRRRGQAWVDRRLNRSRYDAQLALDEFAGSLRDRVDTEEAVDGWVGVVAETMQPSAAVVWVRES